MSGCAAPGYSGSCHHQQSSHKILQLVESRHQSGIILLSTQLRGTIGSCHRSAIDLDQLQDATRVQSVPGFDPNTAAHRAHDGHIATRGSQPVVCQPTHWQL